MHPARQKKKAPACSAGAFLIVRIVTNFRSPAGAGRPGYQDGRRPVAPGQQAPGGHGRPGPAAPGVSAYSDTGSFAAICWATLRCRLALGQRRHHRGTGGAGRDRRLGLLVAAAEADIGQPLQQRQPGLLRMLVLGVAAGLADLGLGRHRQILELRHPRRAGRRTLRRLRNEGLGRRRLGSLDLGDVVIREQRRLLRDRADGDVAIGRGLQRSLQQPPPARRRRRSRRARRARRCRPGAAVRQRGRAACAGAGAASSFWAARSAMRWLSARSRAVRSARRLSGEPPVARRRSRGGRRHCCGRSRPARCRWRRRRRGSCRRASRRRWRRR